MEKPSVSHLHRKTVSGRRVRLIPATPRQEPSTPSSSSSSSTDSTQSPEISSSDLRSGIPRGIMRRVEPTVEIYPFTYQAVGIKNEEFPPSAPTSLTSSSSLGFSDGQTFEEITSEVIREMREAEERKKEKSKEGQGAGTPLKISAEAAKSGPQEIPVREVHDPTGVDEEGEAASDDWKSQMENTVNLLIVENAEQNAILKAQGEQLTKVVNLVDRVISWMDRETQSSNQPSPAISAAGRDVPQQNDLGTNLAGTSGKRKTTTTSSQPPAALPTSSTAKRNKRGSSLAPRGARRRTKLVEPSKSYFQF